MGKIYTITDDAGNVEVVHVKVFYRHLRKSFDISFGKWYFEQKFLKIDGWIENGDEINICGLKYKMVDDKPGGDTKTTT
jgi:uncharacterized pyridoxamine 5'-phosphate oxidase family protein